MKQRRSYLVTLMVVVFLSWNLLTYYFLTYNTQQSRKEDPRDRGKNNFNEAKARLDHIAAEVKRQIAVNEALLRDLLSHQKDGEEQRREGATKNMSG